MKQTGKDTVPRHSTGKWIQIILPKNHTDVHILKISGTEAAPLDFQKLKLRLLLSLLWFVLHQQQNIKNSIDFTFKMQ